MNWVGNVQRSLTAYILVIIFTKSSEVNGFVVQRRQQHIGAWDRRMRDPSRRCDGFQYFSRASSAPFHSNNNIDHRGIHNDCDWSVPTAQIVSFGADIRSSRSTTSIRSYLAFLEGNNSLLPGGVTCDSMKTTTTMTTATITPPPQSFVDAISESTIQALRAAGRAGDFRLIFQIMETVTSVATKSLQIKLPPRLVGEAVDALSRTKANASKIRQLWTTYYCNDTNVSHNYGESLTTPEQIFDSSFTAFELNTMIRALASRSKIRASLDLYHQEQQRGQIICDSYTASTLLHILEKSIELDQAPVVPMSESKNNITATSSSSERSTETIGTSSTDSSPQPLPTSPCWQWNEAIEILNTFDPKHLNNHAYAAALKLNERASQIFPHPVQQKQQEQRRQRQVKHHGANIAMALLERMKSQGLSPDVVTCTMIVSTFEKGYQWKAAVALLNAMNEQQNKKRSTTLDKNEHKEWTLPKPNVYTYASTISACARCNACDEALYILEQMRNNSHPTAGDVVDSLGEAPNTWVYNAALAACVDPRYDTNAQHQYRKKKYLHESESGGNENKKTRSQMALTLLEQMKQDHNQGLDTKPDTVSYNTVLAALDPTGGVVPGKGDDPSTATDVVDREGQLICEFRDSKGVMDSQWSATDTSAASNKDNDTIMGLLQEMKELDIPRDAITYRNSVVAACRAQRHHWGSGSNKNCDNLLPLLDMAIDEIKDTKQKAMKRLKGPAASDGMKFVFSAALSELTGKGQFDTFTTTLLKMVQEGSCQLDSEDVIYIMNALAKNGRSQCILNLLEMMVHDKVSLIGDDFFQDTNINLDLVLPKPSNIHIGMKHYTVAITSCLAENDIETALGVLEMMRSNGLGPSPRTLQEIALAYSRLALDNAALEAKHLRKRMKLKKSSYKKTKSLHQNENRQISMARAQSAFDIVQSLENPDPYLLSTVAKACSSAGLWHESRKMLQKIHEIAVKQEVQTSAGDDLQLFSRLTTASANNALRRLPGLHRNLLKLCASRGNVTAALWFVDDIQSLSSRLHLISDDASSTSEIEETHTEITTLSSYLASNSSLMLSSPSSDDAFDMISQLLNTQPKNNVYRSGVGMKGEDWKLLMIAASKCGHWKVCLGTLQFLRPYLEATNPSMESETNGEYLSREYERLARSLTSAVLCFEIRSQYAWSVRAIDDWIDWSGRRPRKEAVLSAFRILAARGRGSEVSTLLSRVIQVPPPQGGRTGGTVDGEISYEQILFVGAITFLHNNGLYEDADELFVAGVSKGHLPFELATQSEDDDTSLTVDLHGMNTAFAHSAVRVALQQQVQSASWSKVQESDPSMQGKLWETDMIIVTGRGRNSAQNLRPVLRPEVQRMLLEEFYPPLSTVSVPGNMGALRVPASDINAWLKHQREQKGARLLAIADVLKNFSSGSRLKQMIAKSLGS